MEERQTHEANYWRIRVIDSRLGATGGEVMGRAKRV